MSGGVAFIIIYRRADLRECRHVRRELANLAVQ
jgi:hypothetical protein